MSCSRNLCKHLKHCYQTKTIKEMSKHDFQFFANLMKFLNKKFIKYFLSIFIFQNCPNFPTRKKKNLIMTCAFECFQSFKYILKEFHEFLNLMGPIIIFGEKSFIFSFVGYGLVKKSLGARCTFEQVAQKTKCQKMNVNIFRIKLG
jgi:hypothetical protein